MATTQERGITTYAGPQALVPAPTNWNEIQRVFARMVSKSEDDNQVIATMIACKELGFNPVLNHVFLIKGSVYVSHKGLLNLAHRSGVFDGIELLEEWETDTHWLAKVAVYRKDMSRPFVYTGRYSKRGDRSVYGPEMAVTRAETMALRRAFDVGLPVKEEIDALEGEYRVSEATPGAPEAAVVEPMSPGSFVELWDELNRAALNQTPSKEIVATLRLHSGELGEAQYQHAQRLVKDIIEARKAGQPWVARATPGARPDTHQPDALTQEIIEAEVPAPVQHPAAGLPAEAFTALLTSVSRMAYDGISDGDIKRYMSEQWRKLGKDQRGLLVQLWDKIAAARKAGEPWPNPDAATDEAPGDLLDDPALDETGEPTGDPSIFDGGVPAGYAG